MALPLYGWFTRGDQKRLYSSNKWTPKVQWDGMPEELVSYLHYVSSAGVGMGRSSAPYIHSGTQADGNPSPKTSLKRTHPALNSSSHGLLSRIRQVLHVSHRGTEKWGGGQVDTCWAVNVPNTADLFLFICLWHQRDLDMSKSAREQATSLARLGVVLNMCVRIIGKLFQRTSARPFMSHWITEWG